MSTPNFVENTDYTILEPYYIRGKIVHGFKRGSTQLGFPTANVDPNAFATLMKDAKHGVYFGWAQVLPYNSTTTSSPSTTTESTEPPSPSEKLHCEDYGVFKCMLSLGKNVQFDATQDTLEAYIHHQFKNNFYDHQIEVIICGYIRPQLTFDSLESLINAIKRDVEIGDYGLSVHKNLAQLQTNEFFTTIPITNEETTTISSEPQ